MTCSRVHPQRGRRAARAHLMAPLIVVLLCVASAQAYEIGHVEMLFVDPARGDRQIPTEVFYPAEVAGEEPPLAPPPPRGFPLVAFAHGYLIPWDDYRFAWEGLVPAGYILVLPDTEGGLFPNHGELGLDLAFVIAELRRAGSDPGSPFYGGVALSAAVTGHSMGGGASFLAAAADPTISALANLAAAETEPSAIQAAGEITVPALLFSGSHDCVTPPAEHQLPMYEALASDCRTWVNLLGASHCQFAEYNFTCALGELACPDPTMSRPEQHALTLALLHPWLRYVLYDDASAWLEFSARLDDPSTLTFLQDCDIGAVDDRPAQLPGRTGRRSLALAVCPNPAVGTARFRLRLPTPGSLRIEVLAPDGRRMSSSTATAGAAGLQEWTWSGNDACGRPAATGSYLVRVVSAAGWDTRSFLWIAP